MNSLRRKRLVSAICSLLILTSALSLSSCGKSDTSPESDSSEVITAAPQVTLQLDSDSDTTDSVDSVDSTDSTDNNTDSTDDTDTSDEITPAMWVATSPSGNKIYMMGSMHALKDECYPLPDYVQEVYDNADTLAVECDITDTTASFSAGVKEMQNMYLDDGEQLSDYLVGDEYDEIDGYLKAHGTSLSAYEGYKLWYLSSVLESFAIADADLDTAMGFDVNLLNMAHEDGKEIYEVESVDFQVDMLINVPDETYAALLKGYSVDITDLITEQYSEMYDAWKTGDTAKMEELNETDMSGFDETQVALVEDYNNTLLTERNKNMAEQAEKLADSGSDVLFVVGSAHFGGDDGIIALLENDGYTCDIVTQ